MTYWISWGKTNLLLQTAWFLKRFLKKTCHFKSARNHSESSRWKIPNCMWEFKDLEKALDILNHDILLDHYGIRRISNDWFRSYFNDRSHFGSINGFNFDYKTIKYGIPQGLVLGPLLFLIFINDLNITIKHPETFHFADDTCLFIIKDLVKQINKVVNKDLKFQVINNASKSKVFIFRRSKKKLTWLWSEFKTLWKKTWTIKLDKIFKCILRWIS